MIRFRTMAVLLVLAIPAPGAGQEHTQRRVGPGVVYHSEYDLAGPWAINWLEIDLGNPHISLTTVKARDQVAGTEPTSHMARRNSRDGHWVVGAINGDFYTEGGVPVGLQVVGGHVIHDPHARSAFGVDSRGRPIIEVVDLQARVLAADGRTHTLHGTNKPRNTDELILYNRYHGSTTQSNSYGVETPCALVKLDTARAHWLATVESVVEGQGDAPIPAQGFVLSGHGSAGEWMKRHLAPGDTVRVSRIYPPLSGMLLQAVGGLPRIVRDGRISVETDREGGGKFEHVRHPRTAVGFSADSARAYFAVVDGRWPNFSVGMTLRELARLMLRLGAHQAVNLDGGGSSTIVVRDSVMNRPSDGSERSVANAVLIVSSTFRDTLSHLDILPERIELAGGHSFRFRVTGHDRFFNPVTPDHIDWHSSHGLGAIDTHGTFTAAARADSGWVLAVSGAVSDSARVVVYSGAEISNLPRPVVLESGQTQPLELLALDSRHRAIPNLYEAFPPGQVSWEALGGVGEIDDQGLFTARAPGEAVILARFQHMADTTQVFVGVPVPATIDDFSRHRFWQMAPDQGRLLGVISAFTSPP